MKQHEIHGLREGDRIELDFTDDPYTQLRPGALGTVTGGDNFSIWVRWDDGSNLGICPDGGDRFHRVPS